MVNDVVLNKGQTIERCINRVKEEYQNTPENLSNYTKQDSIILNIQRACEASIDLAMHYVLENKFGIPQSTKDVFDFLYDNKIIDEHLAKSLKSMVGFRNIAVHDYQKMNLEIVQKVIENHLEDLLEFSKIMLKK
ncbi:type VII toxin-antitoxin system HepT family RNase toxin [Dehalobacterium formicoaceticum]|uniref:DUF86 domain-containing protein n=1 Tax=Dehalobacterium formicoaceticum TaxID=51515 RepID=A0ABT1Y2J3_9FIRM|nr:DUF86 domain-containing protein [Dehalobacterium formicoaceticum]MCR6545089.1 DUF86 domain-containing protein [Dehalobacterium formicoaceticum]